MMLDASGVVPIPWTPRLHSTARIATRTATIARVSTATR
jgi:hypothetical protein